MSNKPENNGTAGTAWTSEYARVATDLGKLVEEKQLQYGNSVGRSEDILHALYPDGIQPYQYSDVLLVIRILDKLSRIASRGPDGQDRGGESPFQDIAGYGLLGVVKDGTAR